jgi:PTH1 family peptidyl-tRNA hydrolase
MKLVVGLGNPGRRYEGTRHNVGFIVARELARAHAGPMSSGTVKARFQGETVDAEIAGEKVLLLTPSTFMNESGASVLAARDFYKIALEEIIVVCDDLNLPLAKLRARAAGSAGGQKGLEDIVRRLGSEEFARLRIGIGAPPNGWNWPDFVLSKFKTEELPDVELAVARSVEAVGVWVREGIQACMNRYNG